MRELTLPAPLIMLPGLAADARLFGPQCRALGPNAIASDWPALIHGSGRETLQGYARRWAHALHTEHVAKLDSNQPWFLAGSSMGGMVAQEMLAYFPRPPQGLLLMGSAQRGGTVSRFAQWGAMLAQWVDRPKVLRWVARGLMVPTSLYDAQDDDGRRLLCQMMMDANADRLQWGVQVCVDWHGPAEAAEDAGVVPVKQIHGAADRIISGGLEDADVVVPGAGHFLNLSHERTVNRWLFDEVTQWCGIDEKAASRVEDPRVSWARRPEVASQF